MSIQKWLKNALSGFFLLVSEFFVRRTKIAIAQPIFKSVAFFFLHGPHYVDFIYAFDTTLIQLEMTEILPKYVAQTFFNIYRQWQCADRNSFQKRKKEIFQKL